MTKILISDLHLEESRPDITNLFITFLQTSAQQAETLYILGDLFEVWIGDDDTSSFNQTIIHALKQATTKGLSINIMHGNRDFLLGKKFFVQTGCHWLRDSSKVDFYQIPVLLMHGDVLCTQDIAYQKFRKKARNLLLQKLFLWQSLAKRKQIATRIREQSKNYTSISPEHIMDVTQTEVERVMQKHQVQYLIHGHTHREAIHSFTFNHIDAKRIVLGAWHTTGSALIWHENGKYELIQI